MSEWRDMERRLAEYLRSRGIATASDGLGEVHFLVMKSAKREVPDNRASGGLVAECPHGIETCPLECERVVLSELAKALTAGVPA